LLITQKFSGGGKNKLKVKGEKLNFVGTNSLVLFLFVIARNVAADFQSAFLFQIFCSANLYGSLFIFIQHLLYIDTVEKPLLVIPESRYRKSMN